jgi:hypothetical protein
MKLYSDEFFFDPSDLNKFLQNRTEQNRTEQNRTEQNRTEQNFLILIVPPCHCHQNLQGIKQS